MATTTLTPHQRAVRSTVSWKVLMALTGLIMVAFLLVHMYGNLKAFQGEEAFNHYAEWLKNDVLYPLMPHGTFIWVFRAVMLAAIVAHMYAAWVLTQRAHSARSAAARRSTFSGVRSTNASRAPCWAKASATASPTWPSRPMPVRRTELSRMVGVGAGA